jgi:hypothetical protein
MRPGPTSTVPDARLTFVSLKRVITICTPLVEENPGLVACPPPFTAKGVLLDPRIRIYDMRVGKNWWVGSGHLTILLTSSAEPSSTEQADSSVLEEAACEMSNKYSGAA